MDITLDIKLIIFDVDGTLRTNIVDESRPPFNHSEWILLPNVAEKIRHIRRCNPRIEFGIASNQACVGRGELDGRRARGLIDRLIGQLFVYSFEACGVQICYHAPEDRCECRKPEPGLLIACMDYYKINPHNTLFVGDMISDGMAAARALCHFAWAHTFFGWH